MSLLYSNPPLALTISSKDWGESNPDHGPSTLVPFLKQTLKIFLFKIKILLYFL